MSICPYISSASSEKGEEEEQECMAYKCPSDITLIESVTSGFLNVRSRTQVFETSKPPNIPHELNVAKSLLQQGSSRTGDNVFDHLATMINTVMTNPEENIVDYFEEFSFNLREQKFRITERFPMTHYEPPITSDSSKFLFLVTNVPTLFQNNEYDVCKEEIMAKGTPFTSSSSDDLFISHRLLAFNENVVRLHLYWALCGFGILYDEVLHLAYALQKIQFQPAVEHARFWGKIYGLRKPYYIVEAKLTLCEMAIRLERMREEMMQKMDKYDEKEERTSCKEDDPSLIPGVSWQDYPLEDLIKMSTVPPPIPKPDTCLTFDIPPEAVGTGVNRLTYFVVNDLSDEWIELPIVTPAQITIARQIKKFLTGDLEAEIMTYPSFPGTEKHYLRSMIARITAGTYVAPEYYYRRLTKQERKLATGEEMSIMDEYGFGEEEDEEDMDNDALITENEQYEPNPRRLMNLNAWVHVRPNILQQGRVVYFDEIAARKAMEEEAKRRLRGEQEVVEEREEEDEEEEGGQESVEDEDKGLELEPALFTPLSEDKITEFAPPWTTRYSSLHNKINQLVMVRSNLWPGAFSFTFEKFCDSIYMGWGFKYIARNITIPQIPPIQYDYYPDDYLEMLDPTPDMEQAWWLWLKKKEIVPDYHGEEEGEEEEKDSCDYNNY